MGIPTSVAATLSIITLGSRWDIFMFLSPFWPIRRCRAKKGTLVFLVVHQYITE